MKKLSIPLILLLLTALIAVGCGTDVQDPVLEQVFTLDKTEITLAAGGDPAMLSLRVENVDDDLLWSSEKEDVVEIAKGSAANKVTLYGLKEGNSVISVTAGDLIAVCKVYVTAAPKITLFTPTLELLTETTAFIRAEANFEGELSYSSDAPSVADVNAEGLVSAKAEGIAIITVSGGGVSAACTVTVKQPYVTLDRASLLLAVGEQMQLDADSNGDVVWTSSDHDVATVKNGLVTAISVGETVITAQYGSAQAVCNVKVKDVVLTLSLSEQGKVLPLGQSFTLQATLTPEQTGENAAIRWSVQSGQDIVSVSNGGVVTSLGVAGDAVVRASSVKDPDAYDECSVHVPAPYEDWIAIGDEASLRAALSGGNENKNMYLIADIDLGGKTLIGTLSSYSGTFDGCGHTISNFRCGVLFGQNSSGEGLKADGVVKRLSLQCTLTELKGNFGLFGEFFSGTVQDCFFDVTFGAESYQAVFARNAQDSARIENVIVVAHNPNNTAYVYAGTTQAAKGIWKNVYYTGDASVGANGPVKKTESELSSAAFFAGWDESIWEISDGALPKLRHSDLA